MQAIDIQAAAITALQSQADWLVAPMQFLSFLGGPEFFLLVIPLLYWCWDPDLGFRAGVLVGVSAGLNAALKVACHLPRPYWAESWIEAYGTSPTFGLPSAHAQGAMVFWGLLAATARRAWVWAFSLLIIFLIGISRIFLGVHYPIDTVAGWGIGIVLLVAFLLLEGPAGRRLASIPVSRQVLVAFAGSLALVSLSLLAQIAVGDWQVPPEWTEGALERSGEPIDPLSLADSFVAAGLLFGFAAGGAAQINRGSMCAAGQGSLRLARYVFGIGVTGAIWVGLGLLVPEGSGALELTFQYLRAVLAAAWISYGAPEVFARLNRTGPTEPSAGKR